MGQETTTATGDFVNVGRPPFWKRGFFATQTAYVLIAFAAIAIAMAVLSPVFLTPHNLLNISKNFSYIAIVSLGATLVIITGGIDLSVGSVTALTAVMTMIAMHFLAGTAVAAVPFLVMTLAVLFGLLLSAGIGAGNGVLVAKVRLSPFVTTLGMLSICRGLTYVATQGRGQAPTGRDVATFFAFTNGTFLGLPVPLVYLLVLAMVMGLALHHTAWGRHVFAIGGNAKAAALTGVPVDRVRISVYMLCGLSAGAAGILMAGWLGSAPANLAMGYELRVIAAAVIGGANLAGGIGGATGAVVGAALIEVIRNGFVLIGVDTYWQDAFVGLIIILAVIIDQLRTRRAG
jgi:ribose transport system permease protein